MHKLAALLMPIAAGLIATPGSALAQMLRAAALSRPPTAAMPDFNHGFFAVGGMTGDRMAGGMEGGMTGGMGGVGIICMPGASPGNTDLPVYSGVSSDTAGSQSYRTNEPNATDARSRKI